MYNDKDIHIATILKESLDNMIKWQVFASLPEQFQGILNSIQEQTKIEKPILDAQQLEEIEYTIQQAILLEEEIHLSYFRNGHIHHEMVTIINIDFHNKQLITTDAFRNRTIFPIGVPPHRYQVKNPELPQNEKMNFLLQVNTKFRSGGTIKF
ncbi:YolD-like family protein [Bacillus thuringiensis]|uniref:YolD-like family protein n=1 Tax=Bacillus thuringiensis TaxID=1428 RepID=UPI0011A86EB9